MTNGESADKMIGEFNIETGNYLVKKRDYIFSALLVVACIAFTVLSLWGGFKAGFTVTYVMFFSIMTAYLYKREVNISFFGALSGILALISSLVFGYSSNLGVNFYLYIIMFILSGIWFLSLSGKFEEHGELGIIGSVFSSVFGKAFGGISKTVKGIFSSGNGKAKGIGKAIIGILCAVPLLLIVLPVLCSADMAFEGLIKQFGDNMGKRVIQLIIGIVISPFVISYAMGLKKDIKKETKLKEPKTLENVFIISFLGVISLVYVAYLFSQLAYFFSAFQGILPEEYIPAQYARRGFFEMCVIAGINFALVFTAILLSRKKDKKPAKIVSALCIFISLFTLVLISTVIAKMVLYIQFFGMTVLRITTSGFMVFLFTVFIALILRCFTNRVKVVRIALISATVVLLVLGFGNVEGMVAKYNVEAYKSEKLQYIDIDTIENLGLSGVPALYDITENVDNYEYKKEARRALMRINEYYNNSDREIGDWRLTDQQAYDILDKMFK